LLEDLWRPSTIVELATGAPFACLGATEPSPHGLLRFLPAPAPAAADVVPVGPADGPARLAAPEHRFSAVLVCSVGDLVSLAYRHPDFLVLAPGAADPRTGPHVAAELAAAAAWARARGVEVVALGIRDRDHLDDLRRSGVRYGAGPHVERRGASVGRLDVPAPVERLAWLRSRVAAATDAHEVAAVVCDHVAEMGLLPSVYVERHGVMRCIAQRGYWQVMDGIPVDLGVIGRTFRQGRPLHVDTSADHEFIQAVPGLVAEITVPLRVDGRVAAVFSVEATRSFVPAEHHEVERVAAELERGFQRTGLEQPTTPLHALVRADAELATLTDEESVAHAAVRMTCAVAGTSSAMIAFPSPGGETAVRAAAGPLAPALRRLDPAALRTLAGELGGVSSCLAGGDAEGRVHPVFDDLRRSGGTSLSAFPVRCGTAEVGLLFAVDQVPGGLGAEHREATELLAATVGRTLDHVRVHATLRFRAERDPLTMVGNRGAFDEALATLDSPARRGDQVAVLLVDIDRFKQVNDRFGHMEGDQVLVETAQAMLECLRVDDRLFRIGGDEFAILVPGIDQETADDLARRLVERTRPSLDRVGAGISVGAAVRCPGERSTDAVGRADGALYTAKAAATRA